MAGNRRGNAQRGGEKRQQAHGAELGGADGKAAHAQGKQCQARMSSAARQSLRIHRLIPLSMVHFVCAVQQNQGRPQRDSAARKA
jgi:hypothetical protein